MMQQQDKWSVIATDGEEKEWNDPLLKAILESHAWDQVYSCPGKARDTMRLILIKNPS